MNYSMEANTSVEDMAGLEYDTCCWTVRLMHLRYYDNVDGLVPDFNNPNLEREHSTQFQIYPQGHGWLRRPDYQHNGGYDSRF